MIEYKEPSKFKIKDNLQNKNHSLQFLPESLLTISRSKNFEFKGRKLKSAYIVDLIHNLLLKYYFKKANRFNLSSIVLKDKYGHLYNYYIEFLLSHGTIKLIQNYKAGKNARVYKLDESILDGPITRFRNTDKVLLKKFKNSVSAIDEEDIIKSAILPEVKQKLVDDLFHIQVDYEKSIFFLDSTMQDLDVYNKNKYSIDAIRDQHIFYHFDAFGRMHTNFTILKSFIRKNCLMIDGEETCEVDIPNSQPLFLTKLILNEGLEGINLYEFELFRYLTTEGKFYQYLSDNSDIKDRHKIKDMTYKVLFGKNYKNKSDLTFSRLFPTIYEFIKSYKLRSKDYRSLSHELQRAESNLVFNKIIKEIIHIYPDIKMVTVHDSIIFQSKYVDIIEDIFNRKLKQEFDI